MVTEGDSLDRMRLRLFKSELEFLKFTNRTKTYLAKDWQNYKGKVNESWSKLVSEDRDNRIGSLLVKSN